MVDKEEIGVVVLLVFFGGSVSVFQICDETGEQGSVHSYIPISSYLCTIQAIVYNVPLTAALEM